MSKILGPTGVPVGQPDPIREGAEINVNGRIYFRDHVPGGVRWMIKEGSLVSAPKPSDMSIMCEVVVQTLASLKKWSGGRDWCDTCDAPQMVNPDGEHVCASFDEMWAIIRKYEQGQPKEE